jgi:hypothetical protein
MSNGMAFVAGAGLAGIAALLFLKGGATPGIYNLPAAASLQPQTGIQPAQTMPQVPGLNPPALAPGLVPGLATDPNNASFCAQQQLLNQRLQVQLDQMRVENEQLKTQQRNQQFVIDALSSQAKTAGWNPQGNPAAPQLAAAVQASNPNFNSMLWALGGMGVTVLAGLGVAGLVALFSRQQRPSSAVQLVHPINQLPPSLPQRRRSEFASARFDQKRNYMDYDEYDEYDDYDGR